VTRIEINSKKTENWLIAIIRKFKKLPKAESVAWNRVLKVPGLCVYMLYLDSGKQEHGEVWIRPPRKIDGAIYINNCSTIFIDFKASKIDSRGAKYI